MSEMIAILFAAVRDNDKFSIEMAMRQLMFMDDLARLSRLFQRIR